MLLRIWRWLIAETPDPSAALVARLIDEATYLRAQLEAEKQQSALLRQEVIALADKRAMAEIDYFRRPAPTVAAPAEVIQRRFSEDIGPFANHLFGGGHVEPEPRELETAPEDDLAEATIERAVAERERRALEVRG